MRNLGGKSAFQSNCDRRQRQRQHTVVVPGVRGALVGVVTRVAFPWCGQVMARKASFTSHPSSTSGPYPDSTGFGERRDLRSALRFDTTRSGARSLRGDSGTCAVAVRVVLDSGVQEGDAGVSAEIASRSKSDIGGCARGAGAVGQVFIENL